MTRDNSTVAHAEIIAQARTVGYIALPVTQDIPLRALEAEIIVRTAGMPKQNRHRRAVRTRKGRGAEPAKNPTPGAGVDRPGWQVTPVTLDDPAYQA